MGTGNGARIDERGGIPFGTFLAVTSAQTKQRYILVSSAQTKQHMWLSQVDTLSSKHTPDARKTRFSLFGFNLTQARAADDELWCVYDPVFDLFLPCEPAA